MRAGAAKYLNKAWHKVEHTLGTNKGTIETWWEGKKTASRFNSRRI